MEGKLETKKKDVKEFVRLVTQLTKENQEAVKNVMIGMTMAQQINKSAQLKGKKEGESDDEGQKNDKAGKGNKKNNSLKLPI